MIIQQNVVSGHLCLSVHPLDYLSLSENIHNWRSCHALDGEYRAGNMNYMMDENTVVCYLRADKQAILPHFPEDVIWNSKKWRVLIYMADDETMFFLGRQYPFSSLKGIELIKNKLLPAVIPYSTWDKYHQPVSVDIVHDTYSQENINICAGNLIPLGNGLLPLKSIVINGKNTYQFNDVLSSSCYTPLYSYRFHPFYDTGETTIRTQVHIGKQCLCPKCNKNYIDFNERLTCEECDMTENNDNYFTCDMCGTVNHIEYEYVLPMSDTIVCQSCFDKYTHACEECGIRDIETHVHYRTEHGNRLLCDRCVNWLDTKKLLRKDLEF